MRSNCPKCRLPLQPLVHGGVALHFCLECKGLWFDGEEVARVIGAEQAATLRDNLIGPRSRENPLSCPEGHGSLREVTLELESHQADLSGCPQCVGAWIERTDLVRIRPHLPEPDLAADERIADLTFRIDEAQREADEARIAERHKDLPSVLFLMAAPLAPMELYSPVRQLPLATYALIAVNLAVFGLQLLGSDPRIERFGIIPAQFMRGIAPWTIITSMFLHGGPLHLIGNMYFLAIFGDNVEDRLGVRSYLAMYFVGGVVAALAHIASDPSSDIPMIGASGAISAVLGAYAYLFPHRKLYMMVVFFLRRVRAVWYLLIWLAMQLFFAVQGEPGVAWWAHIGGLGAGVAWAFVYRTMLRRRLEAAALS